MPSAVISLLGFVAGAVEASVLCADAAGLLETFSQRLFSVCPWEGAWRLQAEPEESLIILVESVIPVGIRSRFYR